MSQTRQWAASKDTAIRFDLQQGMGASQHLPIGTKATGTWEWIAAVAFSVDWTGVGRIVKAVLNLWTDDGSVLAFGSSPSVTAARLTADFTEGAHDYLIASDYTSISAAGPGTPSVNCSTAENTLVQVDVTSLVGMWAPKSVLQANGKVGGAATAYGLRLQNATSDKTKATAFWSHEAPDSSKHPYIELTYEMAPGPPNAPGNTSILPLDLSGLTSFEGDFTDPNPDNLLSAVQVDLYASDGVTRLWSGQHLCSESERTAAHFSFPAPSALLAIVKPYTTYKWAAQVRNQQGYWSAFSALQSLSLTPAYPALPGLSPNSGSWASLQDLWFRVASYSGANPLGSYQFQLAASASDWADPSLLLWDTGRLWRKQSDGSLPQERYNGEALNTGTYKWRAQVWDTEGLASGWSESGTLTLTADFNPAPGGSVAYPQVISHPPFRLVLRGMGANRGPGAVVGIIEDAQAFGADMVWNSAGQMHFTLRNDHPQISVCEPKQTHVAVEQWGSDGYREVWAGLLWDFEATEREVVFHGLDYLGLYQYVIDDRFDVAHVDADYLHGGSKYVDLPIATVISAELSYAQGLTNSPVGFITVGTVDSELSEHVTMWASQQVVLRFVSGLINSHRQGTGKTTRISVKRTSPMYSAPAYSVVVEDDPGITRDNLRLSYGELVQGFRVIAFGDQWASRVNLIGRSYEGVNVYYATQVAPGIDESVWGRFAIAQVQQNIADQNDLQRRAQEAAITAGKLGKHMGIGLRTGYLRFREGYDLCDSLPVDIQYGAVDTTRYGSGYWTVWGIAWEAFGDGHSVITLTLLPREDSTPPSTDLIPSVPISTQPEWQIGWVPPDPTANTSKYYLDQSSGKVYQRNEDGSYTQIVQNPRNNNLLGNSGFEITPLQTMLAQSWIADHAWSTATSAQNLATGGSALAMTTDTY